MIVTLYTLTLVL